MRMSLLSLPVWLLLALATIGGLPTALAQQSPPQPPAKPPSGLDRFWSQVADKDPPESMGLRSLFGYMLTLGEQRVFPERFERLCDVAAKAQEHDPQHRHYGNLKWTWRDEGVTDTNAVEFVMQDACVLWIKHSDWLPEAARRKLRELMVLSIEGCLRHRVPVSYTNIAILNAGNLIILGELFDRPDAANEGYARLNAVCVWTWAYGVHEFCSPTYYGTDIGGLDFLIKYARREAGRQQGQALWQLFWMDVAANYFPPAARLAGAHSRSYDYLRGLGHLDHWLEAAGWITGPNKAENIPIIKALETQTPPETYRKLSGQFPRTVRQSWGEQSNQSRTHVLYSDITLSTAAAQYGEQDMLLTVDVPGDRKLARCFFIPDGREDPYGEVRYPTSSAKHLKALHVQPYWAAAQNGRDALALAVYRPKDLTAPEVKNVQSHFVFRRGADAIWLDGKPVQLQGTAQKPATISAASLAELILQYGTALVGIKVLAARDQAGAPAAVKLVDDGHAAAARLTIEHRATQGTVPASVALWTRIGTELNNAAAIDAWRTAFAQEQAKVNELDAQHARLEIAGTDGPVKIHAQAPFGDNPAQLTPAPSSAVFEVNGTDLGRIGLQSVLAQTANIDLVQIQEGIQVPRRSGAYWEAESGLIIHGMCAIADPTTSAGKYLAQEESKFPLPPGSATYTLHVPQAGKYYLWGRVLAVDPQHDSFFVAVKGDGCRVAGSVWNLRNGPAWQWQVLQLDKAKDPTPLELAAGTCRLQIRTREPGTKLDRLFLTADPNQKPEP